MGCPTCNGPLIWEGSAARGKLICRGCKEPTKDEADKDMFWGGKRISHTLWNYIQEVHGFHRDWCAARKHAKATKAVRSQPQLCDCGHSQHCPYTDEEIEQREIQTYGVHKP